MCWGATARDAEYDGDIGVNSVNITAVQRAANFEISRRGLATFIKNRSPVTGCATMDNQNPSVSSRYSAWHIKLLKAINPIAREAA